MGKEKLINTIFFGSGFLLTIVLYYFNYFCTGTCYVQYEDIYTGPILSLTIGFLPTTFFLLFFNSQIVWSWIKHLGWLVFVFIYIVFSMNPYSSDILSVLFNRENAAYFLMAILFIITLIYAPIMSRKLKRSS
jgi:hypothetical protein